MERRLRGGGGARSYSSETLANFQPEKNFSSQEESRSGGGGGSLFQEFYFQNRRVFGDLENGGVGIEVFKFCRKCVFRVPGK